MEFIYRGILMVEARNLGTGKVQIVVDHLKGGVPQDLLQAENIAPVKQVIRGEGVATEMGM